MNYYLAKKKIAHLVNHPNAYKYLLILCIVDASFFPITPMVMLLPMAMLKKNKLTTLVIYASLASLFGALIGYYIGVVGKPYIVQLCTFLGYEAYYVRALDWMQSKSFWGMMTIGLSPIPFKIFTISAGVMGIFIPKFVAATLMSRGLKFYILCNCAIYSKKFEYLIPKKNVNFKFFGLTGFMASLLIYSGLKWLK